VKDRNHIRARCGAQAALNQLGDFVPVDVAGGALIQQPGNPKTRELCHPPVVHEDFIAVDGLGRVIAGMDSSFGPHAKPAAPGAFMIARREPSGIAASHHQRLQLTGRRDCC
jgi:hypothetical protein